MVGLPNLGLAGCTWLTAARVHGVLPAVPGASAFHAVVQQTWILLSLALNQINRSMDKDDLYPVVVSASVLDKLDFVAELAGTPAG